MKYFLLLLGMTITIYATAQFPDILIYKGKTEHIFTNPLEQYLKQNQLDNKKIFKPSCSACWRGYIATWEIRDRYLYLVKLEDGNCGDNPKEIPLRRVFPKLKSKSIKALWYSGKIRVPQGKIVQYFHMGYASKYEKDLFLLFRDGKLLEEKVVDNRK